MIMADCYFNVSQNIFNVLADTHNRIQDDCHFLCALSIKIDSMLLSVGRNGNIL